MGLTQCQRKPTPPRVATGRSQTAASLIIASSDRPSTSHHPPKIAGRTEGTTASRSLPARERTTLCYSCGCGSSGNFSYRRCGAMHLCQRSLLSYRWDRTHSRPWQRMATSATPRRSRLGHRPMGSLHRRREQGTRRRN